MAQNGYKAILTESRKGACLKYRLDRMEGCQPGRFHVHDSAKWHGMAAVCRGIFRMNTVAIPLFATLACRRLNSRDEATLAETTVSLSEGTARASDMAGHGELSCAIG